jgi:UDP-glucose 4-epimerase
LKDVSLNILLTGGAGYIGSHTAVVLSQAGHNIVLLDNFCNSHKSVLKRLQMILGKSVVCIDTDIRNTYAVSKSLEDYKIDAVIHFAGLKAVGESVVNPIEYYANNVQGTISLLEAMKLKNIKSLVFSSSATVYGDPQYLPIDENHPTAAVNPYGRSKLHIEEMLRDLAQSDLEWAVICLRYFNPVGAHSSGLIGEDPDGLPNNLMPHIGMVASGRLPFLNIYGNDYSTDDGTGMRDYIHVMDLAEGHLAALAYLKKEKGFLALNLGTGRAYSVMELVKNFEIASNRSIPLKVQARRPGDIAKCWADPTQAMKKINWTAHRDLNSMCSDSWKWQQEQGSR